jgi:hypothetical protein
LGFAFLSFCFLYFKFFSNADDAFRGGGGEFSGLPPVELGALPQLVKVSIDILCPMHSAYDLSPICESAILAY